MISSLARACVGGAHRARLPAALSTGGRRRGGARPLQHAAYDAAAFSATGGPPPQGMPVAAPMYEVDTWLNTGYEVYKGRSAVQFKPIVASFKQSAPAVYVLDRKGVMLLELANSVGQRTYDWSNKISFALSVTEMAELFLVPNALQDGVSMFHDPNMNAASQGQVKKTLKASMMPDGVNVSLSVSESGSGEGRAVNVPLSPAEFTVAQEMARFLLPRCLGLDKNW